MLSGLFVRILNMSLTASLVILVVLIARLILRRAPRIFSYCLWAVVLFRLLCPISFSTSLSLLGTLGQAQVEQGSLTYISEELFREPQLYENGTPENGLAGMPDDFIEKQPVTSPDAPLKSPAQSFTAGAWLPRVLEAAAIVWVLGIMVILIYDGMSLVRLRRQLRMAVQERDNIYTCSLPTAFVMGLIRPKIYLPTTLSGAEREYILLHEQVHIKRGDHVVKTLAALALCIHWFNPMVWVAFYLSSKDMEMSCDEAVLRKMGPDVKKEYSASLLNLATGRNLFTGVPLAFGEGDTGSRIKNVLKYKKHATIAVGIAAVVCLILGICLVSNPTPSEEGEGSYFFQRLTGLLGIGQETQGDGVQEAMDGQSEAQDRSELQQQDEQRDEAQKQAETEKQEQTGEEPFRMDIREISTENRTVDKYVYYPEWQSIAGDEPIKIAEKCIFEANYRMDSVVYEEISFEEFAELIQKTWSTLCYATADEQTGELTHIQVWSAHAYQGIRPYSHSTEAASWLYQEHLEQYGEDFLEEYFELVTTLEADIADAEGVETIEIYTGDTGAYAKEGMILYRDADGQLLGVDGEYSYHHPTTYYVNETPEGTYLMRIHLENRDSHGEYYYHVYRLGEDGEVRNIAGSGFSWDSSTLYDEEAFKQWLDLLNSYYEGSRFLMEVREDEMGVKETAVSDRYTFEKLSDFTKYDEITIY